jgi:type IV secretion system protein VirB4
LSPEVIAAFASTWSPVNLVLTALGVGGGGALFVSSTVPVLSKLVLPNPKETRLADYLPFDRVLSDGRTVQCRDGTICQVLEVTGIDDTFLTANEREGLLLSRKDWLDSMADSGATVRVFTIRERTDVAPKVEHEHPILRAIARQWNESFRETYRNRQIITVAISSKSKTAVAKLNIVVDTSATMLHEYQCKVLDQMNPDPAKRPLAFWARIASPISKPSPAGVGQGASEAITADTVVFGGDDGEIAFSSGSFKLRCAVLGLRGMGDFTYEAFVQAVSSVNGEIVIHQMIDPWSRLKSAAIITNQYKMSLATRFSSMNANQFEEALHRVEGTSGEAQTMAEYAMTVFVYGRTEKELEDTVAEIRRVSASFGVTPVREGATAQASWFSQFPSYTLWPRSYKLFSRNIASHVTLDRQLEGLPFSDWGEGPIALFRTSAGTPYSFQFHVTSDRAAVAHAVAIGPTGGGKTTLVNFLTAMALRHHKLRTYMVDRHGGGFIFCNAIGGSYVVFEGADLPGRKTALNPFQCADTVENRSFLRGFLEALSDQHDADSLEEIGFAVESAFDAPGLPRERRSLAAIYEACFSKGRPLRKALQKWVDPAIYGGTFNAGRDTLDLTSTRLVTLDFTRIYEHDDLARAVILYLMHRIQSAITELRCPALIFIDETEPVVRHPMFRSYFLQMLQEYRKRNAAVISAFQRPEAIASAGLGEAIRGQAQTTFFFQNSQAQESEYADWSLTEREWAFIKGRLPIARSLKRSILLKRATGESVILDTNLSPLGPLIRVFFSDEPSKAMAEECMRRYGTDWVTQYIEAGG